MAIAILSRTWLRAKQVVLAHEYNAQIIPYNFKTFYNTLYVMTWHTVIWLNNNRKLKWLIFVSDAYAHQQDGKFKNLLASKAIKTNLCSLNNISFTNLHTFFIQRVFYSNNYSFFEKTSQNFFAYKVLYITWIADLHCDDITLRLNSTCV